MRTDLGASALLSALERVFGLVALVENQATLKFFFARPVDHLLYAALPTASRY